MEIPEGYYLADNGMLKMRESAPSPAPAPPALTDAQLAAMPDEDIRKLARKRLLAILASSQDDRLILMVARELLDRIDGKPVQMTVTHAVVSIDDRLAALEKWERDNGFLIDHQ